ncbi:MAG: hypothetical protein GXO65_00160 [Euryarchaeota archaeon]|nr:hypothetical protein [Euryarchaeota archaeon]
MEPLGLAFGMFSPGVRNLLYLAFLASIGVSLAGALARISIWARGRDEEDALAGRGTLGIATFGLSRAFSRDCLLGARMFPISRVRAWSLLALVWGVIITAVATVVVTVDYVFGLKLLTVTGDAFPYYSLLFDLLGALLLVTLVYRLLRRTIPAGERAASGRDDLAVLLLLLLIVISGFAAEGNRMAAWGELGSSWEVAPVGSAFGYLMEGMPDGTGRAVMASHLVLTMVLITYLPFSNLFHLCASPITTALSATRYGGPGYEED